jgi:uncharacterized protein YkwD
MLSLTWVDYLILAILILHSFEGYYMGIFRSFLDLANFLISFLIGLRFYKIVGGLIVQKFSLTSGFSNAIGFFLLAFLSEIIIGFIIRRYLNFNPKIPEKLNRFLGMIPSFLSGAILTSFLLILIIAFPVTAPVRRSISGSRVANFLLSNTQGWEKQLNNLFGGAITDTINFLTIEPKSNNSLTLRFQTKDLSADPTAEKYMFSLINQERSARGLNPLTFDNALRDVGRAHCKDMFERGYFSPYTLEGLSPFDRIDNVGIAHEYAGENLAFAPTTDIAMKGLMNSPGHKANILSVYFGKVGVGVIDGGIYGETYCQEFTN